MRTTYVYKQNNNNVEPQRAPQPQRVVQPQRIVEPQVQPQAVKPLEVKPQPKLTTISLVETYLLVKAIANNVQREMMDQLESKIYQNVQNDIPQRVEPKQQEEPHIEKEVKEEPPKKSRKVLILVASLLTVVLIGAFGYGYYLFNSKNIASTVEDLRASVDRLYTTKDKTDTIDGLTQNDLEDYFDSASELKQKGEDVTEITDELTTISSFIQDKKKLDEFNNTSYDLTTIGLTGEIESIVNNTKNYTVSSLVVTITNKAANVSSQYETYVNLKLEMQGITDVLTFDETAYATKISQIKHTPNKEELQGIYDILVADKEAAQAQAQIDAAQSQEDLANAQKALEDAKALQQETQGKLEELQEKLQSKINYKDFLPDSKSDEEEQTPTDTNNPEGVAEPQTQVEDIIN